MQTILHQGQLIERVIRRNGYSITEIANYTHVNRRSVYNWFNQRYVKPSNILMVGKAIGYDFSQDFPELSKCQLDQITENPKKLQVQEHVGIKPAETVVTEEWQSKYITLLERHNELLTVLSEMTGTTESGTERLLVVHTAKDKLKL
ncbi:MAG TPA: hypothetical protein VKB19_15975 [Pedobacter sp.]|nr:hypothetical protein [Pedobacter sp.]